MLIIQLTGLSGAGKTTISQRVKKRLERNHINVAIIDGDTYRKTICKDLGFSKFDRHENMRRLGQIAFSYSQSHKVVIVAAINPYEEIRLELKEKYNTYIVHIHCNLDTLIKRDTKGLYYRALLPNGHVEKLQQVTGIDDPYDIPKKPDLIIRTHEETVLESVEKLYDFIVMRINEKM